MRPGGTAVAVLAVVFALNLLGRGAGETYAVFLLPLEREFGWARSQLTSVYSAYLLVGGFIAPLVGLVFDRLGPRIVYTAGLLALSTAFFLASTLGNLWQFYVFIGGMIGLGVGLLGMVPGLEVSTVQTSCCGMAGSFGYEAEHYEVSMKMAELSLLPAVRHSSKETLLVADGTSCRHQISDGSGRAALHVARLLEQALS